MSDYFESRPLLYKLSPSVFLKDYVEKTQKLREAYETLKTSLENFHNEVISSGSSISTAASESDIPDKTDQELKEILNIIFTASERIIAKLRKHTRKALKYGSLIPPPSLLRFELFIILLKRVRKDIEDPDTKVGKVLEGIETPQTTKDKFERKKELETSKPSLTRYEEAKREIYTEERATPRTPQVEKQSSPPPVIQTLPKPVCVDQEIQVDERELSPLLEEDLPETDKEGKDVKIYQDNLVTSSNTYKLIFNPGRSELLVILQKDGQNSIRRLRFKIYLKGQSGKKGRLEDISFESSPYSIAIYENNVVAYIDQNLKVRHSDVYNKYKACVIYADLKAGIESVSKDSEVENLVFRKLFLVGQDDHIHSRCLLVTEESVFLFGGRSFKFKGKASIRQHGEVSLYFTKKMESVEQNSSEFKDSEIDNLNEKGEVAAIYTGEVIFVTKRFEPSVIEIFQKDGTTDEDESIEIPEAEALKGYTVRMNLVNFRGKEEILFSCFCREKDIKFMLLDLKEKEFEKQSISISAEGQEKLNLLYTGFEELESPVSKSGAQELFFYTYRGDSPEVFKCEIKVGK